MTPAQFNSELKAAKPGTLIQYAAGETLHGSPAARAALAAYFDGEVELVQRRLTPAPGAFAYFAVKRHTVQKPVVPLELETLARTLDRRTA